MNRGGAGGSPTLNYCSCSGSVHILKAQSIRVYIAFGLESESDVLVIGKRRILGPEIRRILIQTVIKM
jgi:hypothetical protein